MSHVKILFICCNEEIRTIVLRLINAHENWEASGTGDEAEALKLFCNHHFDLVLLGSGIEQQTETRLCEAFIQHKPQVKIVEHYGGGSGLLSNEIEYALRN